MNRPHKKGPAPLADGNRAGKLNLNNQLDSTRAATTQDRVEFAHLSPGQHRLPCPICDKGPRDDALSVRVDADGAVWQCFRCGDKGCSRRQDGQRRPSRRQRHGQNQRHQDINRRATAPDEREKIRALIALGVPAKHSVVERYLQSRGLQMPDDTPLLYVPQAHHWPSKSRWPCMVAPIVEPTTNEIQAVHQTFLINDGTGKAPVEKPRLYLGPKGGGVVKLTPDDAVSDWLAIGEGIETTLVAIMCGSPAWACLDAGNLAAFPVLDGIKTLRVLADHDAAGLEAANTVADRWTRAGRKVRLLCPERPGSDWNDRLLEVADVSAT